MSDRDRILWLAGMALLVALICSRDIETPDPAPGPSEREQFILTCETEIMAKGGYEPVHRYSCPELWEMTYGRD